MSGSTTPKETADQSAEPTRKRTCRVVEQTAASSRSRRAIAKPSAEKERSITDQPTAAKAPSKGGPSKKEKGSRSAPVTGKRKKSDEATPTDGEASTSKKQKTLSTGSGEKNDAVNIPAEKTDIGENGSSGRSYWLMKAEPESRIVKGVDVKFSIDDLKEAHRPEPWDGM